MLNSKYVNALAFAIFLSFISSTSFSWFDETHMAVTKVAGYAKWYNAAGPDIAKTKAGNIEGANHYYNDIEFKKVTPRLVLSQAERYNDPADTNGHLYGAIIGAIREYNKYTTEGKYAEYHLIYAAHYIGDLANPLHHGNDEFNSKHHSANDGIVNDEVLDNIPKIEKNMYEIKLSDATFEKDMAKEIARIANISIELSKKLRKENRDMTKDEAYIQLGHAASLLKAVLKSLKKP